VRAAVLSGLLLIGVARVASAETAPQPYVDRVAVRFFAPETGGADHPRFVLERDLAFEARLEVMADSPQGPGDGFQERDVRNALEHDVAEQVLASLGQKLIDDSPADKRPAQAEIDAVVHLVSDAQVERLGGRPRVDAAAAAEQLDASEVDAILYRGAFAAWYLDRAVSPLLHPSEEQLRDVYRTAQHPYRGQPFDAIRSALSRWFVIDRVRVAESAFLQAARSHVKIVVTPVDAVRP
jgi:hypothetical protein